MLMYHSVGEPAGDRFGNTPFHDIALERFERHMRFMKNHYDIVPVDTLLERFRAGVSVKGLASITFDDGYVSVRKYALPVLEALGLRATLFLTAGLLQGKPLWRDKVRWLIAHGLAGEFLRAASAEYPFLKTWEVSRFYRQSKKPSGISSRTLDSLIDQFLADKGLDPRRALRSLYLRPEDLAHPLAKRLDFGNHTANHYILSTLDDEEQREEIESAERVFSEAGLGISRVFCIPNGQPGDWNETTLEILREKGYWGYLAGASNTNALNDSEKKEMPAAIMRLMAPDAELRRTREADNEKTP